MVERILDKDVIQVQVLKELRIKKKESWSSGLWRLS